MRLQPHLCRYWLNPNKDCELEFKTQVNQVCQLYKSAAKLLAENIHLISVDEMTGIQALERVKKTKLAKPGQVEKQEFEYIRHGTQSLIGNWHVAIGKIIAPTIKATRTELDFVEHIRSYHRNGSSSRLDFYLRPVKYSSLRIFSEDGSTAM